VLSVQFTPSYPNAKAVTKRVTITVDKAKPTITWDNPANITYGTPLGPTQLNATADVPGSFAYTPPVGTVLNAGPSQPLFVAFTPADTVNYTTAEKKVPITVDKATPTVTWATPATITYGTPLGTAQFNATANVPGAFKYSPDAGTVLNAGPNQILSVLFDPADGSDYTPATKTVTITVDKATPVITWNDPANITYGTPLSSLQLNATTDVPGTFVYSPPAGTVLGAGPNQVLSVAFTPANTVNYNMATKRILITVDKPVVTVTWANPANITYGTPLGPTQLNATADVPGMFVYTPPAGTVLNAGPGQVLTVTFTPSDTTGLTTSTFTKQVTITVDPAPLTVTADDASRWYGRPNETVNFTATYTGFVNGDTITTIGGPPLFKSDATTSSPPGKYGITAYGLIAVNYRITFVDGTLTVTQALMSTFLNPDIKTVTGKPQTYKLTTVDNVDPFGSADSYTATIDWGDHTTSAGTVVAQNPPYYYDVYGGGDHTYSTPDTYAVTVTVSHKLKYTTTAIATGSARVTSMLKVGGPQAQPEQLFVEELYRNLLGREADAQGLKVWTAFLQAGGTRLQVVQGFWTSPEHRGRQVDQLYATYLHREADPSGRAFWVNVLLSGGSETAVADAFLTSEEYRQAHADTTAYLTGLYADVLGRAPDAAGRAAWQQAAQGEVSRAALADAFLESREENQKLVDQYYADDLGRTADPIGAAAWVEALATHRLTPALVEEMFLASEEFFAHAQKTA
jgi:MBG domain (YGX type)/Domain of unknown function (DUF4214)